MSGYSGWFDPICYQFYFYNVNSIGFAPEMNMAYRSFLEEIKPCCEHWISSSEKLLLKIHDAKDGYLVRKISDLEDVNYSLNSISNIDIEDQSVDEIKLSLCSSKIPRQFSTPSKDIQPDWKKNVMYYMSCKNWSAIGEKEQREWLYKILNCSPEDLEKCCFPSKCFASGSETFVLHHKCISLNGNVAYANEILKESGIEQNKDMFVEYIYVSIPRYLLKHMNLSFDLQDQWKNRLKQLSSTFKISVGGIKADCFRPCRATSLSTINGNYRLGFSERIPDIGWGMCITEKQINSLNKSDALFDCLYQVDLLKNGNVYLQLTPSVCMVQVENVQKLWKLVSKKIQLIEYMDYSACEVPNSMQMGIELENLCIDEFGYYSFKI